MLANHLPSQDERYKTSIELIQTNQHGKLSYYQALPDDLKQKGDVKDDSRMSVRNTRLQAKVLLGNIPLEYQDNTTRQWLLELHEQSANSPEIQSLRNSFKLNQVT